MSDTGSSRKSKKVQYRVTPEMHDQFMMALRHLQTEGEIPVDDEKQDAMRQLMRAFINNPEIIHYGAPQEKVEETDN
jgi:hypothetical protein